jgi:hypothetical protein
MQGSPIAVFVFLLFVAPVVYSAKEAEAHHSVESQAPVAPHSISANDSSSLNKLSAPLLSDVRVLIDISGSMKKTDPANLRKSALDMIVRLLPNKSRAGIWLFGNDVNMIMSHGLVDANWRKQAVQKADLISSIALYTNIGKALEQVSFDRDKLDSEYKTHIILLTDGVVDINKEAAANLLERQRILSDVLPRLKSSGYLVHTIALSAEADADLLKKISVATDGRFVTANSADELTSTFLKIFDQAVPAERVPLDNNGFLVDASVKEFTALIFRRTEGEKTVIATPDGKELSSTSPEDDVNWYRTDAYDLITASRPRAGQWKIKTDITTQSRITVVSDLRLVMEPLKNNIRLGDSLSLDYSFQENLKTITNSDFLNLLSTSAIVAKEGTEENVTLDLTMPAPPEDGIYHQSISAFKTSGDYEVHLYVDGKTFKREFKHSFSVRDSMMAVEKSNQKDEHGNSIYRYLIKTDEKLVDLTKTQIAFTIKSFVDHQEETILELVNGNHWEAYFKPEKAGEYHLSLRVKGETRDGEKFEEMIALENVKHEEKVVIAKQPPTPKPEHEQKEEPSHEKPLAETNHLLLYIALAFGNLVIILLGFFGYRMIMGGKAKEELSAVEKVLSQNPAKSKDTPSPASEKMEINLSEENPPPIPMNNDDFALDNLFPLDNLEDSAETPKEEK